MTRERERLGSLRQYFITGETGRSSNSGSVQSRTFALSRLQFRGLHTQLFLTVIWFLSPYRYNLVISFSLCRCTRQSSSSLRGCACMHVGMPCTDMRDHACHVLAAWSSTYDQTPPPLSERERERQREWFPRLRCWPCATTRVSYTHTHTHTTPHTHTHTHHRGLSIADSVGHLGVHTNTHTHTHTPQGAV
jgi:hypothetical protein